MTPGNNFSGSANQATLGMGAIEVDRLPADLIQDPGRAVGGADLADDGRHRVRRPVDHSLLGFQERPIPAAHVGSRIVQRRGNEGAVLETLHRDHHGFHRRSGDFVSIQAALAGLSQLAVTGRPDRPRVHMLGRLHHGHAPLRFLVQNGPVQRIAAAVAYNARVKNQERIGLPKILWDHLGEHGAEDEIGPELVDRRPHPFRARSGGDPHGMPAGHELHMSMLGQTVVGAGKQQNPHEGSSDQSRGSEAKFPIRLGPTKQGYRSFAVSRGEAVHT